MTELANDGAIRYGTLYNDEVYRLHIALVDQKVSFPYTEADKVATSTELISSAAEDMAEHMYRDRRTTGLRGLLILTATMLDDEETIAAYFQAGKRDEYIERMLEQEGVVAPQFEKSTACYAPASREQRRRWVSFFEQEQRELIDALEAQGITFTYDDAEAEAAKEQLLAGRHEFEPDMNGDTTYIDTVANHPEGLKVYHQRSKLYELTGRLLANEGILPTSA